jgi:hypothetical protein
MWRGDIDPSLALTAPLTLGRTLPLDTAIGTGRRAPRP